MKLVFLLISSSLLVIMALQDFKFRGITWYLFPLTLFFLFPTWNNAKEVMMFSQDLIINISVLLVQMGLASIFLRYKGVTFKNMLEGYIGMGDILFFIILAVVLPFPLFPLFLISSLIISLIIGFVFFKSTTVPLAGLQALMLIPVIFFNETALLPIYFKLY